jgi:CRP/FNR family transcriptional regulator, anaerobic regulatory protein
LKLENYLIQTLQIDSETAHLISQYFEKSRYNSSDLLLKEGEVSNKIFFIEKGLAREYSYADEDADADADAKMTHWFIKENDWVNQTESFTFDTPAKWGIEAIAYTETQYITKENFQKILTEYPEMAFKALSLFQLYLIEYENRFFFQRIKKVEDRLEVFEKKYADILNHLPLNMVASYLNTTPSNLSKVRRKRMTKT